MRNTHSRAERTPRAAGFTLVEMTVVTAIIGVLAGITVPTLMSRRVAANEGAVSAIMRAIAEAELQFQTAGHVDLNNDNASEFGTLGELGGMDPLRGSTHLITNNLLSSPITATDVDGHVNNHGYLFALYLPDSAGTGIVGVASNAGLFDARNSRYYYSCIAWPLARGKSGNRSFFVNQQGQVLKTKLAPYSGKTSVPPAGAALLAVPPARIDSQALATNMIGADGNLWVVVN